MYSNRFVRVSVNCKALSLIENKGKLTSGVCCHQEIVSDCVRDLRRHPEKKLARAESTKRLLNTELDKIIKIN